MALREYRLLRDLQRLGLPAVVPQAVVTGRVDADGRGAAGGADDRAPALLAALPQPVLRTASPPTDLPSLVDAMVVLLVRLHLAGFYWGDVSLSNVLFRRDAGAFTAYLVDAETGELRPSLSDQMREYDVTVGMREHLRRAARPAGQRRGVRRAWTPYDDRRAARRALPRAVGRADRRGAVRRPRRCGGSSSASSGSTTSASTSRSSTSSPTSTATR